MTADKDLRPAVAEILRAVRIKAGHTKSRMAELSCVDERTYRKYEAGTSAPTFPEFLQIIENAGVPALPTILRYLRPECYAGPDAGVQDARSRLAAYILNQASDREIRQLSYLLFGDHGSDPEAQLQMFSAIDHLPIDVRQIICKLTLNAWEIEIRRGGLINPDQAPPDMELLRAAIIRAQMAIIEGRTGYT